MDVSIIILNYKSKLLIAEQLRHFFSQACAISTEIIVIDNDSADAIGSMLAEQFPLVRFIQRPDNRGYAAGNNAGLHAATGRYSVIVNPDTVLTARLIEELYGFMEAHPKAGIAGPMINNPDGSLQFSCGRFPNPLLPFFRRTFLGSTKQGARWLDWYLLRDWDHAAARRVDWLFGSCLMIRMAALEQVGFLDESFFLYLEDTDWCRRFWEQGYEVWYVPQAKAIRLRGGSSEGSILSLLFNKSTRAHNISYVKYFMKYWGKKNPHIE